MTIGHYKQHTVCHLCGWVIPHWVASPHHPLYGTIDHVIPRARGGQNTPSNRKPAHRICNMIRGPHHIQPRVHTICKFHVAIHILKLAHFGRFAHQKPWRDTRKLARRFLLRACTFRLVHEVHSFGLLAAPAVRKKRNT